jgi:hypothetical protein
MNNSRIAIEGVSLEMEEAIDRRPILRQQETALVGIIEALEHIIGSEYWQTINTQVFGPGIEAVRRRLGTEKDTTELFRLQGKLEWAEQHLNLTKLLVTKRNELINIRRHLHE